ncbi:hypothetical protein BaRGS_00028127 [Batillaria attramentaria]|uniref:Glutathione S-transferase n=1 Tax=Batillaria attramentaria TaxID=370345 RepID=A0ABD0K1E4_9CAEN
MAGEGMFLYWGSGSAPCWRPMIVLEEKGIKGYGSKMISFSNKEHKGEEVMKLNPRGQVPTFRDGDVVVNESNAICDYLEFKYGEQGTRLLPTDPAKRALVLQRMHEVQNLHKALIEQIVYYIWRTKPEDINQETLATKKKEAREELERWEAYLKEQGDGSFVAGKEFSMADVYLFPTLAFAVRGKLDMSKTPALAAWYATMEKRQSVQATWPPHWKEGPGQDLFVGV